MSTTGRAFVAVVPPPTVLDAIGAASRHLHASLPAARWATRDQWHLTLQFLGNRVALDEAADALGRLAIAGGRVGLFGGGAFPSARRGRVLWIGVGRGSDVVGRLAAGVSALLAPLGYEPDARPYHAHVTLARLRAPGDLRGPVVQLETTTFGPTWDVDEVVLFRSDTRRDGATYEQIARVRLPTRTSRPKAGEAHR